MMNIEDLQNICATFKGVTQDIIWEDHLCFNIGSKMFLVTAPGSVPVTASLKVTDEEFDELTSRPGFTPAPYLARYKWVYVEDINFVSEKEWQRLIEQAYKLVSSKLPKKIRTAIGL